MANLQSSNNLSDVDSVPASRANLGFPADANRYLLNDGSGAPAALGATESANLDKVAATAPDAGGLTKLAGTFPTVASLLADTTLTYTAGQTLTVSPSRIIEAGGFRYQVAASGAADYHVLTAGGIRLYVLLDAAGLFDAMAFGAVGTGASTPLSTRFATIGAAQAAFPRAHAQGKVVALTDEIDGIAIQEAIFAAQDRLYRPAMRIGQGGRFLVTRKIEAGALGRGIEIVGTDFRAAQQGSTRTGVTLTYVGESAEPLLEVTGTFTRLTNLAFESMGNATHALYISGEASESGGGRNHLEGISVQQAEGTLPFTTAIIKVFNGIDYSSWNNLEIIVSAPKILDYDGYVGAGGTTRLNITNSVFDVYGSNAKTAFKISNANIEQITFEKVSFNNHNTVVEGAGVAPIVWFDTMDINQLNEALDIDSLRFVNCEFDSLIMHPDSRLGKFKRVHMLDIDGGHWQTASSTIPYACEITETTACASAAFYTTGGEVFRCLDAVSRVLPERKARMRGAAHGLAGTSLQGNIRVPVLALNTVLDSFDVDNRHQGYSAEVVADGAHQIHVRTHTDNPRGHWLQGQTMSLTINNAGLVPYTGLTWASTSMRAKGWLPLAAGYSRTVTFQWDGALMWEISRSQDIKYSGSDPIQAGLLPGGRLSLVPNAALSEAEVNGGSQLYYLGHRGLHVPVFRGAHFESVRIPDGLFMTLDGNAGHELYHAADAIHDVWFGITADGVTRIGTGPNWAAGGGSMTLPYAYRGTGAGSSERELYGGVPVNKYSMRFRYLDGSGDIETKAARTLTYLGSIAICSGFPGTTSDSLTERLVANAWNREPRLMKLREPAVTWNYNSATLRQVNANTTNVLKLLVNDSAMWIKIHAVLAAVGGDATMRTIQTAIGEGGATKILDQILGWTNVNNVSGTIEQATAAYEGNPLLGIHRYWWLESANTGNPSFYGIGANPPELSGMTIRVEN